MAKPFRLLKIARPLGLKAMLGMAACAPLALSAVSAQASAPAGVAESGSPVAHAGVLADCASPSRKPVKARAKAPAAARPDRAPAPGEGICRLAVAVAMSIRSNPGIF